MILTYQITTVKRYHTVSHAFTEVILYVATQLEGRHLTESLKRGDEFRWRQSSPQHSILIKALKAAIFSEILMI